MTDEDSRRLPNEPPLLARKESGVISTYNRVTIIYIYILLPFRAHFFFFFFLIRDESQNAGDRSIDLKRKLKIGLIHYYNCHAFPRCIFPNIARPENVKRIFCTTDKETIFVFSRVNLDLDVRTYVHG